MDAQPNSKQDRKAELELLSTAAIEHLAGQLASGHSEDYLKLLAFWSKFYKYSARNTMLILLQKPDAEAVASYTKWQELKRQVAKGSQAAWIYAPITAKQRDEQTGEVHEVVVNWKLVPVFSDKDLIDIAENPLPSLWKPLPDDCTDLFERLKDAIEATGVPVVTGKLPRRAQGLATKDVIKLKPGLDSRNALATLIHEYAHQSSHFGDAAKDKPVKQCELEAESAAYVALKTLGIEYPFSHDYLLNWQITADELKASLFAIQAIVRNVHRMIESRKETTSWAA